SFFMGMDVAESNVAAVLEPGSEAGLSLDNEHVKIKFGSHGTDQLLKGEVNEVPESNLPTNATDEWPQPKQIHSFYIVRYRTFEDQNLKVKMESAEKELQKKNQARLEIVEKIKAKRADRAQVIAQIRNLSVENKQFRTVMDEKRKEMEPLQQALGKLRGSSGGRDNRGSNLCSTEEELNDLIKGLQYRIQHESNTLNEEKQILKEIKRLEGTREKVIANATERAMIEVSLGEKDAIQDQVKLIGVDLDGVRKEKQLISSKLKQLDEEKIAIEKQISALEDELAGITEKRDKTFETVKELRKQREDGNTPFYQNRVLLTKAKSVAASKDVDALMELSNTEVENFMSLWNSNKSFRDDYMRRILPSFDARQLSRDARLKNPDEKPQVQAGASTPEAAEFIQKEDVVPEEVPVGSPTKKPKVQKPKNSKNQKEEGNSKLVSSAKGNVVDAIEEEEVFSLDKLPKDSLPMEEIDEEKLKELKREEEIAKRIQAEERKKKLAEKAASKAALKALKEAEKKLKEREKRERKKAGGAPVAPDESTEQQQEPSVDDADEPNETVETTETPTVPKKKYKEPKEKPTRRGPRRKGMDSVPKAVLKRKK
ncbi:hypothetical protein M569_03909, partial [Genlisea aurea]